MADKKRRGLGVDALFPNRPVNPPTGEPVDQSNSQPVEQSTSRLVDPPTSQPVESLVKMTVYMPEGAEEKLDKLWRNLQRRAGKGNRRKVTKGDILAAALLIALEQWKDGEALDQLASQLVDQSNSRTVDQ